MNPLMRPVDADYPSEVRFEARLFLHKFEKGAWTFLEIPSELAPPVMGAWGMTPVVASVDGREWKTTVWRDKTQRSLLPVPKKVRGKKAAGEEMTVVLRIDRDRTRPQPKRV
jgi:hypothetical protein